MHAREGRGKESEYGVRAQHWSRAGFPSLSKLAPALSLTVRAAVRHKSELTDATASAFV